jgi:hypothetical protein
MFEVEEVRGETVELLGRLERLSAAVEQAEKEGRQETPPASQANSCSHGAGRPEKISFINSVADPGYLSRILIFTHPGSKNRNKREWWKKICCHTFFCSHKLHKIANYFIFEMRKKKIWANFKEL